MPTDNPTGQVTNDTGEDQAATLLYGAAPAAEADAAKPPVEGLAVDDISKKPGEAAPAADAKPNNDGKAAEGDDAKKGEGEIEYKFDMPDGMEVDEVSSTEFIAIAKELNIPADKAQHVASIAAGLVQRTLDGQAAAFKAATDAWAAETKADKEIGGANLATTISHAGTALDKFFDADTRQLFESSGLGNHKGFIKALASIGKSISGDVVVTGKAAAQTRSAAEILYGK